MCVCARPKGDTSSLHWTKHCRIEPSLLTHAIWFSFSSHLPPLTFCLSDRSTKKASGKESSSKPSATILVGGGGGVILAFLFYLYSSSGTATTNAKQTSSTGSGSSGGGAARRSNNPSRPEATIVAARGDVVESQWWDVPCAATRNPATAGCTPTDRYGCALNAHQVHHHLPEYLPLHCRIMWRCDLVGGRKCHPRGRERAIRERARERERARKSEGWHVTNCPAVTSSKVRTVFNRHRIRGCRAATIESNGREMDEAWRCSWRRVVSTFSNMAVLTHRKLQRARRRSRMPTECLPAGSIMMTFTTFRSYHLRPPFWSFIVRILRGCVSACLRISPLSLARSSLSLSLSLSLCTFR